MEYTEGIPVRSVKGHDADEVFVVVRCDERFVYIADGKTRKLAAPKKKNKKHIVVAKEKIYDLSALTDKKLRRLINEMKNN